MPGITDRLRTLLRRIASGSRHIIPRNEPVPKIDESRVRELVGKYEVEFNKRVTGYAEDLASGKISPMEYRAKFLVDLRYLLITSAAIAAGGIGNLRREDIALADQRMREQVVYLDKWVAQLERNPAQRGSLGQLTNRARMYSQSGHALAEEVTAQARYRGFPTLPYFPKKKTLCKSNCKCHWEWQNVDREKGNADLEWKLMASAEHCATCVKRADYGPLHIRAFRFTNLPSNLQDYYD